MFTLGYGPLLLGLFTTSYINLIIGVYFVVNSEVFSSFHSTKNNWAQILSLIVHVQVVTFLMSIIVFVSSINKKVIQKIIQADHHDIIINYIFAHILITIFLIKYIELPQNIKN